MMLKECLAVAVLGLLSAVNGAAQDVDIAIRFGAGPVVGQVGDQQARAVLSLALSVAYGMQDRTALLLEYRYRTFRSVPREVTRFEGGIVPATSVDIRRNPLESRGLALGYRWGFEKNLFLVGGVSLDRTSSTQEVTGQLKTASGIEGLNVTPEKTSTKPGVFAGLQWQMSKAAALHAQAATLSFEQVEYTPASYRGGQALTSSRSRSKVLLDFGISFQF